MFLSATSTHFLNISGDDNFWYHLPGGRTITIIHYAFKILFAWVFFFFAVKISKILSCVLSKPRGTIRISAFILETTWDVSVCRAELPYLISRNTSQSLSGLRTTVSGCFFFFDVFFFLPPRFYNTAVDISFPITKKV